MPTRQTVPRLEAPRLCGEISMGFPRDLRWGWSREAWGWMTISLILHNVIHHLVILSLSGHPASILTNQCKHLYHNKFFLQ